MSSEEWHDPFTYSEVRGSRHLKPPPERPETELDSIMSALGVFAVIAGSLFAIGVAWLLICWVPYS